MRERSEFRIEKRAFLLFFNSDWCANLTALGEPARRLPTVDLADVRVLFEDHHERVFLIRMSRSECRLFDSLVRN